MIEEMQQITDEVNFLWGEKATPNVKIQAMECILEIPIASKFIGKIWWRTMKMGEAKVNSYGTYPFLPSKGENAYLLPVEEMEVPMKPFSHPYIAHNP